jgi:hypothetical protein
MNTDASTGLIGALGVLAIVLLGLGIIVRGILGGPSRARVPVAPAGFGPGAFGRAVASLLSLAVVYKFFFEGYAGSLYGYESMMGLALFVLLCMTLLPAVETLVTLAALTVFLVQNTAVFGDRALGTFLTLLLIYAPIRWFLGR